MKKLWRFIVGAIIVEMVVLAIMQSVARYLLDVIVVLCLVSIIFWAIRAFRQNSQQSLPEVMVGQVVRKRHWRLF